MRYLQPPDILLIYWRVYNSIVNTSKGILFLPPSDAYVRSFLYLHYTLIKLYYTKALSDQASSLAPDWILLQGPRIPASLSDSTTTFQYLQGPHDPSSYTIFTLNLHRGRAATGKKKCCCGVALVMSNSLWPRRLWHARLLCQRWGSPGKNTGTYLSILVAIPF